MRLWKVAIVGILVLIGLMSFGMAGEVVQLQETDTGIVQKAVDILNNAQLVPKCMYCNHYAIVKDGQIVGVLWQNVNLSDVEIGQPYLAKWGVRIPLVYNGQIVGQLFVDGIPFGWQNHHYCKHHCRCWKISQ
jgi:hypothetical protein